MFATYLSLPSTLIDNIFFLENDHNLHCLQTNLSFLILYFIKFKFCQ